MSRVVRPERVVSLLPSATEMYCCIAGTTALRGRSHECDYPPGIEDRAVLTAAVVKFESSKQMNDAVTASLAQGKGLYTLDTELLAKLKPQVVLTQSLCEVCSVDLSVVERAASSLQPQPQVISFNPFSLDEVLRDMERLGAAIGFEDEAHAKTAQLRARVESVKNMVALKKSATPPKVAFMEWTDPIFCGGHWTPEIIALAGGSHPLNEATIGSGASASRAVADKDVEAMDPDWVLVCPCGFDIPTTLKEMCTLEEKQWWRELRAVREGKVVVIDGNQMFNRPGPRLVDALEFTAGLIHDAPHIMPHDFPWLYYKLPAPNVSDMA